MTQKLLSLLLCLLVCTTCLATLSASGAMTDEPAADIKLYSKVAAVKPGEVFTVEIYIENISLSDGILACDLPLSFSNGVISYMARTDIFPEAWQDYGEFVGHNTPENGFMWLRSIPEVPDDVDLFSPTFRVKGDKQLGYKVAFRADKEGVAKITVDDIASQNVRIMVVDAVSIENYPANGMSIEITVTSDQAELDRLNGKTEDSSVADDSSTVEDDTSAPDDSQTDEPSEDEPSEDEPSEDEPSEDESTDNSTESEESGDDTTEDASGDTSEESVDVTDSTEDSGTDISAPESTEDVGDSEEESAPDGIVSTESLESADAAESSVDGEASVENKDGKKDSKLWLFITIAVVAVAAIGGGLFMVTRSHAAKAEQEDTDEIETTSNH